MISAEHGPWASQGASTATRALPFGIRQPAARGLSLHWVLLCQALVISFCSAALVATGHILLAAACMWGMLLLFCLALALLGKPEELVCLLIACAPLINLLRGAMLYSAVPLLYFGALAYFALARPERAGEVARRFPLVIYLVGAAFAYYLLTLAWTGEPRRNMRVFEMAFPAVLIIMVRPSPKIITTALLGVLFSAWAVAVGAYPHLGSHASMRLGVIVSDGLAIGNPVALGLPLALGVLALMLDSGRWVGLQQFGTLRLVLLIPTLFLLAQSSSRAGQLVALSGVLLALILTRRNRASIFRGLVLIALLGFALLHLPFATAFQKGFGRTFAEGRTLAQASSGRADQWSTFGHAMLQSPTVFLFGYGIGSGREVNARVSATISENSMAGKRLEFHALVMHVGIELGLLGLAPVLTWAVLSVVCCIRGFRHTGVVFPAACLAGYFLAAMTVSGFDTVSGTLLGLGLLYSGGPSLRSKQWPVAHRGATLTGRSCASRRNCMVKAVSAYLAAC